CPSLSSRSSSPRPSRSSCSARGCCERSRSTRLASGRRFPRCSDAHQGARVDIGFLRTMAAAVPQPEWLLGAFLLWLRLSALCLLTPLLHAFVVPPTVRVLFPLGLALVLAAG